MRFALAASLYVTLSISAVAPRMTAEQLSAGAERIVYGRVTRSWAAWDANRRYIWTHHEIAVVETLRGPRAATFTIGEPGGTVDGVTIQTSASVRFQVGEIAVLFAFRTPIGTWRVLGGPQGKFLVDRNGAMRSDSGGVLLVPDGAAAPGTSLATWQGLPLGDFLVRVRRIASAHPYRGRP